jgi:hypothetical protein
MTKLKCALCKRKFAAPARGRKPKYCSQACRQQAYWRRKTDPNRAALTAIQSDLMAMSNRTARIKAAIKVLEDAGLMEPRARPSRPQLRLVRPMKPET